MAKPEQVRDHLAARGLCFMRGIPPVTESGVLLVWTGGCNAFPAIYREKRRAWVEWSPHLDPEPKIQEREIEYWMRLPHPSFWPMVEAPATMIPGGDLYVEGGDVISTVGA